MLENLAKLPPDVRQALTGLLVRIAEMAKDDPLAIGRVAELYERGPQTDVLTTFILGILPAEADFETWSRWLDGIDAFDASVPLVDPERCRKTSARGAQQSAASRLAEADRAVAAAKVTLAEAEAQHAAARTAMREASNQLRATVGYRLIMRLAKLVAAPFSMGPMWTIVRATSSYLRHDVAFETSLDDAERARLEAHRQARKASSARILDLLDFHCGDVALEWTLHETMLAALEAHHAPIQAEIDNRAIARKPLSAAAKRTFRRAEERRRSIRPGAPMSDRNEVLNGLRANPEEDLDDGRD